MFKMILFFALLLIYPLFLKLVHISDLRVIPLIVPYALGALSLTIMIAGFAEFIVKKIKK